MLLGRSSVGRVPIGGKRVYATSSKTTATSRLLTVADLGSRVYFDYDCSLLSGADGTLVSSVPDNSIVSGARTGIARDISNSTASQQPTLRANAIGGLKALQYPSTGGVGLTNLNAGIASGTVLQYFSVATRDPATSDYYNRLISLSLANNVDYNAQGYIPILQSGGQILTYNAGGVAVDSNVLNVAALFSGTTQQFERNGTKNTQVNYNIPAFQMDWIGFGCTSNGPGGDSWGGLIGQVCAIVDGTVTTVQGTFTLDVVMAGLLAWKWDGNAAGYLVGQLPANHPYKNSAPTVAIKSTARRRAAFLIAS